MVLNEDIKGETEIEEQAMNWVYNWLVYFFLLDFPISEIPVEFFEENNCRILLKSPSEIKESVMEHQQLRRDNFKDMTKECFEKGECKKFLPLKTRNADYILELNLIELKDIKAEDYYK